MSSSIKSFLFTTLITFGLILVSSLLWSLNLTSRTTDTFPVGFPIQFFLSWGPCPPGRVCSEFHPLNFLADFILWYLVSAFVFRRKRA